MSNHLTDTAKVSKLIEDAKNIAIVPAKDRGVDAYCAAAGLFHMIKEKYMHLGAAKAVKVVYQGAVPEGCEPLLEPEDLEPKLGERELLVKIDYSKTPAAKVKYSAENEVLVLKLGPVGSDFSLERVETTLTGIDYDLIIIVGALSLDMLDLVTPELKKELSPEKLINIDTEPTNTAYASVNLLDHAAGSLCMLVFKEATHWGLTPVKKSAHALLTGLSNTDQTKG